jgi:hypothetical protein
MELAKKDNVNRGNGSRHTTIIESNTVVLDKIGYYSEMPCWLKTPSLLQTALGSIPDLAR